MTPPEKKKETQLPQSSSERVVFTCHCGGPHYLEIWRWSEDGDLDWSVCFVEQPKTFGQRLKSAWRAMRGETVFNGEIYPDDVEAFKKKVREL